MNKKQISIRLLGLALLVALLFTTHSVSGMATERRAVYFDRNYYPTAIGPAELTMAQKEFTNKNDPYQDYAIIDADKSKQDVINGMNAVFSKAKDEDTNYLLISSHGWSDGIIDFTFADLKALLDRYHGHFVIVLDACESGGMIQNDETVTRNFVEEFETPQTRSGEFINSKYNVFAACGKDQNSYMTSDYGYFMKSYFDSSQYGANGYLNADANQDSVVTTVELDQYLKTYGTAYDATPVSQITDRTLQVFKAPKSVPIVKVAMYRLYNPNSGEHFYTKDNSERDYLKKLGWSTEGIGWYASQMGDGTPVYRLYNPNAGDHHYTSNIGERNMLKKAGWRDEGIGWYSKGSVPLYRQYNPNAKAGAHNYTTNKTENDVLVKVGWKAEGIGWYGVAQ